MEDLKLQGLMDIVNSKAFEKEGEITEERLLNIIDPLRERIAFFRVYPDLFVDFMVGEGQFKLFFYQRIFLRIAMRHRYVYATFPRAYSKSFLSMMILMIRCILYPGSHLFVTTGGENIILIFF